MGDEPAVGARRDLTTTRLTRRRMVALLVAGVATAVAGRPAVALASRSTVPSSSARPDRTATAVVANQATAIRFGAGSNGATPQGRASQFFADELTGRSGGAIDCKYFPDGQIGAPRDLLEGIQIGTVQMAEVSTANVSAFLPDTQVFDMPYIFTGSEQLLTFLDSPVGRDVLAVERFGTAGLRAIAWMDSGARSVFNSRRPIRTPDDLRGLKIRVEENPIRVASLNAMGAQATPMAFTEVYGAIQQRVVDGAEGPPAIIQPQRFNEVAEYLSLTEHFITPGTFVIGKAYFDGLASDLQGLVLQVGREAEALERQLWAEESAAALQTLEAAGMKINQDVDKAAFQQAVTGVIQEYSARIPKEWFDLVMSSR